MLGKDSAAAPLDRARELPAALLAERSSRAASAAATTLIAGLSVDVAPAESRRVGFAKTAAPSPRSLPALTVSPWQRIH